MRPVIPVQKLAEWLPEIFPEGTANRGYVVREISAKTIFVMLYVEALEGNGIYIRPDQVTKMSDEQAALVSDEARATWAQRSLAREGELDLRNRWYAPNSREPIRDETLRLGLVALGAVLERRDLPTTSSKPRYALARSFADLLYDLETASIEEERKRRIAEWQAAHLSSSALARINLVRRAAAGSIGDRVPVTFPNGEVRLMHFGPSTQITKAVIEDFAPRFLRAPGVVFLSESGEKVVARDEALAETIGLKLDYSRSLPDLILADISDRGTRLVFVEIVATDGPVNSARKEALLRVASDGGFKGKDVLFLTAFSDRQSSAFRRLAPEIAWGTCVWFMSEPDKLLIFSGSGAEELRRW